MIDDEVLRQIRREAFKAAAQITVAILALVFVAKSVIY